MKKFILIIPVLLLFVTFSKEQCNLRGLFPIEAGMSKFDVINTLNQKSNIMDIKVEDNNSYVKPAYLNGDSVRVYDIKYKYSKHKCISSSDNMVTLAFADNKLYEMQLNVSYYPSEFNKCFKNYSQMFNIIKISFSKYDTTIIKDVETQDQMGEGHTMYKTKADVLKDKYEMVSISYKIVYETKFDPDTQKYIRTGKVDKYLLKLTYVNLGETKFNRSFYPAY
jgi:hypothetical protein